MRQNFSSPELESIRVAGEPWNPFTLQCYALVWDNFCRWNDCDPNCAVRWFALFKAEEMRQIIEDWVEAGRFDGCSPATLIWRRATIRSLLAKLHKVGYLPYDVREILPEIEDDRSSRLNRRLKKYIGG